jgi:(p)ppGpp synthase/HD superfamily hydrolase
MEELIDHAKTFATTAHGTQPYGIRFHVDHVQEVENVLIEYGFVCPHLRAAAWLHDVVEDTSVTLDDLRAETFPEEVVLVVDAVTNQPGTNRKERNLLTYPRIASNTDAITIKLADRIANVRATILDHDHKFFMYKKEYPGFREALYRPNSIHIPMWNELDLLLILKS